MKKPTQGGRPTPSGDRQASTAESRGRPTESASYLVYKHFGVPEIINCVGYATRVGGSRPRDEILDAMREAHRTCGYYASKINLTGPDAGIYSGKPDPDTKYSHLRGLYAYYALTGDDLTLRAGTAIAEMWNGDPFFVVP